MALDGAFLSLLRDEIERGVLDARIDKIYQPSKEEIILLLRGREGARRLLLSANASGARVHFTDVYKRQIQYRTRLTDLLRTKKQACENKPAFLCLILQESLLGFLENTVGQFDSPVCNHNSIE